MTSDTHAPIPDQPREPSNAGAGDADTKASATPDTDDAQPGGDAAAPRTGKTRKERIHGKSQERVLQDLTDDRTIDEAIRESIRRHGA